MIEANYNESYFRLTSTEDSIQRVLTFQNKKNTTVKYIGNYLDDSQQINLILDDVRLKDDSKEKNLIIDQISLFSTNPNFSDFLPLKFELGQNKIQFDDILSNTITEYNLFDLGYDNFLKNCKFSKFEEYLTGIPQLQSDQKRCEVNSLKIGNEIYIYIVVNGAASKFYRQTITNLRNGLTFVASVQNPSGNVNNRLKTNGYNMVVADETYLYDIRDTTLAVLPKVAAGNGQRWVVYQPFERNGAYYTLGVASLGGIIRDLEPRVYLINNRFDRVIEFIADASVDDYNKGLLSTAQSICVIDTNLIGIIINGYDEFTAANFLLIVLNKNNNTFAIKSWEWDYKLPPNAFQNLLPIELSNQDFLIELNKNTYLDINNETPEYDIEFGFAVNFFVKTSVTDIFMYYIKGKLTVTNEETLDFRIESNYIKSVVNYNFATNKILKSVRRFRNLLLFTNNTIASDTSDLDINTYTCYNGTNKEEIIIPTINKNIGYELDNFSVNRDVFIEIGRRGIIDNGFNELYINFAVNPRNDEVYLYSQDYASTQFLVYNQTDLSFKILNAPKNNELEIIKIVIDIRLRNSKEKQELDKPVKTKVKNKKNKIETDYNKIMGIDEYEDDADILRTHFHII